MPTFGHEHKAAREAPQLHSASAAWLHNPGHGHRPWKHRLSGHPRVVPAVAFVRRRRHCGHDRGPAWPTTTHWPAVRMPGHRPSALAAVEQAVGGRGRGVARGRIVAATLVCRLWPGRRAPSGQQAGVTYSNAVSST